LRVPLASDRLVYWTVVDEDFRRVPGVDDFLFSLARSGRAENTGRAYAMDCAHFLRWCGSRHRAWMDAKALDDYQAFLLIEPTAVRGEPRASTSVNRMLTAVRGLLRFCIETGRLPRSQLGALFGVGDYRWLPAEVRGDRHPSEQRALAQHRVPVPLNAESPAVVTYPEFVAMLRAARSNRDRFLAVLLHDCGLRIGEALGLRGGDLHLAYGEGTSVCAVAGPHVHVRRRQNPNGATAKSRRPRVVPATNEVVEWWGLYLRERHRLPGAAKRATVLLNLASPVGRPMGYRTAWELMGRLGRRAGVHGRVTPHTLRHCYGTALAAAGVPLDVIANLMGHVSTRSTEVYLHPSDAQRRAAVDQMVRVRASATTTP